METRAEVSLREKGKELAKARLQPCSVLVASGKVCSGRYAQFTAAILFILIRLPREAESKNRHLGQGRVLHPFSDAILNRSPDLSGAVA